MMRSSVALLAVALLLGACTPAMRGPACPGSAPPRCLTAPECEYDAARQCTACRCSSANGVPAQGPVNGESVPPIH